MLGHLRTICQVLHSHFKILGCLFQFPNVHNCTSFENHSFMSIVINLALRWTYHSSPIHAFLRKSKGYRLTSFTAHRYNKQLWFFWLGVSGGSSVWSSEYCEYCSSNYPILHINSLKINIPNHIQNMAITQRTMAGRSLTSLDLQLWN